MGAFCWGAVPPLATPRLTLRALSRNDSDDLFAIYGDAEVMRFAADPAFPDRAYVDMMLASVERLFAARAAVEWGIVLRATGRVVGTCGLHTFEPQQARAEVGCLLARACWGQGLMREALGAVLTFGFRDLALQSLRADIDADNARSLALFARLGFQPAQPTGTLLELYQSEDEQ